MWVYARLYDLTSFDIRSQNFKKPLDIFWPQIERKRPEEYLVLILKALSDFLASRSSLKKKQIQESRVKTQRHPTTIFGKSLFGRRFEI